jgi:transposase
MIALPRTVRVWAYGRPTDLRKGYNGLVGLVKQQLRLDPLGGDLFLFVSRRSSGCKVLMWDGTGLCIFMKRSNAGASPSCEERRRLRKAESREVLQRMRNWLLTTREPKTTSLGGAIRYTLRLEPPHRLRGRARGLAGQQRH